MTWEETLLRECRRVINRGGEVRVQFCRRSDTIIPIVRSYPDNQIICKEVKVLLDD